MTDCVDFVKLSRTFGYPPQEGNLLAVVEWCGHLPCAPAADDRGRKRRHRGPLFGAAPRTLQWESLDDQPRRLGPSQPHSRCRRASAERFSERVERTLREVID